MVFTLIIALIATLFYINMMIAEVYNNKHHSIDDKTSNLNASIRFILIILMGIFWGITIRFW
jgi:hypothetical protein